MVDQQKQFWNYNLNMEEIYEKCIKADKEEEDRVKTVAEYQHFKQRKFCEHVLMTDLEDQADIYSKNGFEKTLNVLLYHILGKSQNEMLKKVQLPETLTTNNK